MTDQTFVAPSHQNPLMVVGDVLSTGAIIAAFIGALPSIAAIVGIIWYGLLIYESKTVQRILHRRRIRKMHRLKRRRVAKVD